MPYVSYSSVLVLGELIYFRSFRCLGGGRGKPSHKGRRRHFTDAEELKVQMEREQRQKEWRVRCERVVTRSVRAYSRKNRNHFTRRANNNQQYDFICEHVNTFLK